MSDRREHVSVEQHEQLRRDFVALQEQFEAADGVLSAIGRSAGDPETVLSTIVESACRLCRSQAAHLYLLEGGLYRLIKSTGLTEEAIRFISEHPFVIDRETLIGRVGLDRVTQQIPDVLSDPDYGAFDHPAHRRIPHHHGCADAPRRRGRRVLFSSGATRSIRSTTARWRSSRRSPARPRWRSTA